MNFDFSDDQQAIKRTAKDLLADRFKLERVRELAEAGDVRRRRLEGALRARLAGHLHRRAVRRPGARHRRAGHPDGGARLRARAGAVPLQRGRRPGDPGRRLGRAEGSAGCPGIASGERARRGGARAGATRRSSSRTRDNADVIVLCGARGRAVVERSAAEVEPVDDDGLHARATRACARAAPASRSRASAGPGIGAGLLAVSAELTGVAQRAMEMAVEYARDRKQFGRPIGAYQAVSHRCAQMLLETEGARSADLLRRLDRGRRAGARWSSPPRWPRPTPRTPAGACARRRCRCTAGSASPGSTTSTSS